MLGPDRSGMDTLARMLRLYVLETARRSRDSARTLSCAGIKCLHSPAWTVTTIYGRRADSLFLRSR
jgi:hypothetical protein